MIAAFAGLLAQAQPATLAGISLGAGARGIAAAHAAKPIASPWGPTWGWNAPGVGSVRVTADQDGNVALVDVVPAATAPAIDLPAAPAFPVGAGHEKYTDASSFVESDDCKPSGAGGACFAYTLDGGELVLQFGGDGAGPLREAIWGDRALLVSLGIVVAGTSI
ncbi:MAG TPA: hypothetical protein VMF61_11140 [Candidatus Acidoferrales bacterium]|nr:hypothetical protein [Candidatus Acidoferrales bacterium]